MTEQVVDFIVPVFNEGLNIRHALEELYAKVPVRKRVMVVYDFDDDDTVPVVRSLLHRYQGLELVKNTLGRGVLNAIREGIRAAKSDVVIITMADLSDDIGIVSDMIRLIRAGQY